MFRLIPRSIKLRQIVPRIAQRAQRNHFWSSTASPVVELGINSIPAIDSSLNKVILAAVLLGTSIGAVIDPFEVIDTIGKGLAATSDIPVATIIISERPIVIWPSGTLSLAEVTSLFDQLSPEQQKAYLALSQVDGNAVVNPILSVRAGNGFQIEVPSDSSLTTSTSKCSMIFSKISRINHSCTPNAAQAFSWSNLRMEIYSLTNINKQQEILIEYLPALIQKTRSERQLALRSSFGFDCLCSVCAGSEEEVKNSDARRNEIKSIVNAVKRRGNGDRKATMQGFARMKELLKEEGYLGPPEFDDPAVSNAFLVYLQMTS